MASRARNWSFIVYPESAIPSWQDSLADLHVPIAISPLHDRDKLADGSPKKPHYHVLLTFSGNKSLDQIKAISDLCSGVLPIPVESIQAYFRYLWHADNPEKAQYQQSDVVLLSGFTVQQSKADEVSVMRSIVDFVIDNNITELRTLVELSRTDFPEWFEVLFGHSNYMLIQLINSNRYSQLEANKVHSRQEDKADWVEQFNPQAVARLSGEHE